VVSPRPELAMPRFSFARTPPFNISPGTIAAKPGLAQVVQAKRHFVLLIYISSYSFSQNFYKKERFACTSCTTCVLPL